MRCNMKRRLWFYVAIQLFRWGMCLWGNVPFIYNSEEIYLRLDYIQFISWSCPFEYYDSTFSSQLRRQSPVSQQPIV